MTMIVLISRQFFDANQQLCNTGQTSEKSRQTNERPLRKATIWTGVIFELGKRFQRRERKRERERATKYTFCQMKANYWINMLIFG